MKTPYGYIPSVKVPEDYVFGAANQLGGIPLVLDGQWDFYLPKPETQDLNGYEVFACVSFTINNAIEILERREFEQAEDYSDRFLATISGTAARRGNDPKNVGQAVRDNGVPKEYDYPFSSKTWEEFYAIIPQAVKDLALLFKDRFTFGYEWCGTDHQSIMDALRYSPVGVSVYAWKQDSDGIYIRPRGGASTHFTLIYGYKRNYYWKVFDSYDNTLKKLRWDFGFDVAQRYTLHSKASDPTMWKWFLKKLREILGL